MNRIEALFSTKKKNILSIYFTSGFPELDDTTAIIKHMDNSGVDMIEIGMPFSDPVADGPVIQRSSEKALQNGISLSLLFNQLSQAREITDLPLIIMGYINPVFKYGMENFLSKCREMGIDGVIIPDLPPEEYMKSYATLFKKYGVINIFLISPQTPDERITYIDSIAEGFLYIVSTSATTGSINHFDKAQLDYFKRIKTLNLKNPSLIGFGISDKVSFHKACEYANGAIIGSAFIRALEENGTSGDSINQFVMKIRN